MWEVTAMKREGLKTALWAVVLSLTGAAAGVGCMITGFALNSVSVLTLALSWTLAAAVLTLCFSFRRGLFPVLTLILLGIWLWWQGPLALSTERLLWDISYVYDGAYSWGVVRWSENRISDVKTTTALCWVGLLIIVCISHCVVSRRGSWLGILVTLLPFFSCVVVTDTVPSSLCLFALMLTVVMLLFTATVRERDPVQGNRLSMLLLLPVMAALGLLFLLNPRDSYDKQKGAQMLEDLVTELFQSETPQSTQPAPVRPSGKLAEDVDLSIVGPKTESGVRVMSVTSPTGGTVYLRGYVYDRYTGAAWESTDPQEYSSLWPSVRLLPVGELRIKTVSGHPIRYQPYYPVDADWLFRLQDGALPNDSRLREYSVSMGLQPDLAPLGNPLYPGNMNAWLELPDGTLSWAKQLASEILGEALPLDTTAMTEDKARAIAAYVRNSAVYDLDTPRMPGGADFAQWFLESSDTGYCVHFASATTVLLRAAGIPARYVSGYMVDTVPGEETRVTYDDAHAWVEYCMPGGVWRVLESTPGYSSTPPETTAPTETTEATTRPEETDPPPSTEPPKPGETTQPSQTPTSPGNSGGEEQSGRREPPGWLKGLLLTLLAVLCAAAAAVGQWWLRLKLRQRRMDREGPNGKALLSWRLISRMAARLGEKPPEELRQLALKAKFSQHTLNAEELGALRRGKILLTNRLKKRPMLQRLLDRLLFALY